MIKGWPDPYSLERTINHTGLLLITVKDYLYVKCYIYYYDKGKDIYKDKDQKMIDIRR